MSDNRNGAGTNSRPLNDTIAGTGPGIPDDSLAPGQDSLPEFPNDEEVAQAAENLGAPNPNEAPGDQ